MADQRRQRLRRKYLTLGAGELAAATAFAAIAVTVVMPRLRSPQDSAALWSAMPLLVVVVQAGVYWLLARRWITLTPMPAGQWRTPRLVQDLYQTTPRQQG